MVRNFGLIVILVVMVMNRHQQIKHKEMNVLIVLTRNYVETWNVLFVYLSPVTSIMKYGVQIMKHAQNKYLYLMIKRFGSNVMIAHMNIIKPLVIKHMVMGVLIVLTRNYVEI
jgi:hypothetical protein